jgi:hypothetical protein
MAATQTAISANPESLRDINFPQKLYTSAVELAELGTGAMINIRDADGHVVAKVIPTAGHVGLPISLQDTITFSHPTEGRTTLPKEFVGTAFLPDYSEIPGHDLALLAIPATDKVSAVWPESSSLELSDLSFTPPPIGATAYGAAFPIDEFGQPNLTASVDTITRPNFMVGGLTTQGASGTLSCTMDAGQLHCFGVLVAGPVHSDQSRFVSFSDIGQDAFYTLINIALKRAGITTQVVPPTSP